MGVVTAVEDSSGLQRDFSCEQIALAGGVPSGWTVLYDTCGQYFADAFASPFASFGTGSTAVTLISGTTPINVAQVGSEFTISVTTGDLTSATSAISVTGTGKLVASGLDLEFIPANVDLGDIGGTLNLTQIDTTGASNGDVLTFTGGALTYAAPSGGVDGTGAAGRVAYWLDTDTLTSDANFLYGSGKLSVNTTSTTGHLNLDAGSGAFLYPFNMFGTATSAMYAQISNLQTNNFVALSLNQESSVSTIRGMVRRYGSTHATTPNVLDLWNTQNAAVRLGTNNTSRFEISGTGGYTFKTLTGTGDKFAQLDAAGVMTRSSLGPTDITTYTFTSGLTETTGTVRLGGSLTQNTTVDGAFAMTFNTDQFIVGNTSTSWAAPHVITNTGATGSTLASSTLHVAGNGGDNNAKLTLGVGDSYGAGLTHFFNGGSPITRLYNMTTSQTIRVAIGGETADIAVFMSNNIGRFGSGFSSTSGLHSTLQSGGSLAVNAFSAPSSNITIDEDNTIVARTTGTASPTWTMPAPTGLDGRVYILHNRGTGTVTLSQNISSNNGTTFNTLAASQFAIVYALGSTWYGVKVTSLT